MKLEVITMLGCLCSRDGSKGIKVNENLCICSNCGSVISNGHQRITIDTLKNEVVEDVNYSSVYIELEKLEEEGKL